MNEIIVALYWTSFGAALVGAAWYVSTRCRQAPFEPIGGGDIDPMTSPPFYIGEPAGQKPGRI